MFWCCLLYTKLTKSMRTNQKSFFITLRSNTSLDLYPQNTLSRFTTKLPICLDFKNSEYNEWCVGIVKFSCTKIEGTINPASVLRIVFTDAKKEAVENTIVPVLVATKIKPDDNYQFDILDILWEYPELRDLIKNERQFFDCYTDDLDLPVHTTTNTAEILVEGHLCKVTINKEYTLRDLFDALFGQISKEERVKVVGTLKKSIKNTARHLDVKTTVEIRRLVEVIPPEVLDASDDYGIPNYMCIYCDVVQPQIFGDVMARGMVMHPVKYANYQYCDIVNIQYLPLEKSQISDISILIADENGEQINFKRDSYSTMVVLHFRKGI